MAFNAKCRITGVHKMSSLQANEVGLFDSVQVTMQPVFGGADDEANREWSKYTPSGEIRLVITNPKIFPELVNGKTFLIHFEQVE